MKKRISDLKPRRLFLSLVFLIGVLFAFFLLQDLPFTFGDDLNVIHTARESSWGVLLRAVLNPFTPAWYVHGEECLLTTRAFETFLFKAVFQGFGYSPNAFQAVKVLGFAGCGLLISLLVLWGTENRVVALAAAIFFYLLPPVYRSLSWIADLEILAQMFVLLSFCLGLRIYHTSFQAGFSFAGMLLLCIVSAWLGMKLKETARIIPFVLFSFVVLHQNRNFLRWLQVPKNAWLLVSILLLFIPVIPLRTANNISLDARSHGAMFVFEPDHFKKILGPLLLTSWPLLLCLVGGMFTYQKSRDSGSPVPTVFLLLWLAPCLLGFAMNFKVEGNLRYLATPLIPLIVLSFVMFEKMAKRLPFTAGRWVQGFLLVLVLISSQRNLDEVIFARNFFSGVDIADYKLTKQLYQDYFKDKEASWQELDDFYRGKGMVPPESGEIKIKGWDENSKERLQARNLQSLAEKWGAAYILSFDQNLLANQPKAALLFKGSTSNRSLYSILMPKIKKKTHRAIYLFKYSP